MAPAELIAALASERAEFQGEDAQDRLFEVLDGGEELVVTLADDRLVWLPSFLDGRVFTHRVSALEVTHDVLEVGPDLAAVAMLTESATYQTLVDASPIVAVTPWSGVELLEERGLGTSALTQGEAWLLPVGHLAGRGVEAGDLVGIRITEAGFDLCAVDAVKKSTAAASIAARLGQEPERPERIAVAVWMACDKSNDAFREPIAPLSELLPAIGLVLEGEWVAPAGFDFDLWRASSRVGAMMNRHDLDLEEGAAVLTAMVLFERIRDEVETIFDGSDEADWDDGGAPLPHLLQRARAVTGDTDLDDDSLFMDPRDALDYFEEPIVVETFLWEASSADGFSSTALDVFTHTFEKVAPRAARPAMLWLRGRAHEHVGDIESAEQSFRAAEALDPSWPLTLISLARLASDRGDAERGLSLLRRAGALPDAPLVQMLEAFQTTSHPALARNAPCWCGSGRKYKQCHLNREQLSLEDRAAWLYQKAITDLLAGPSAALLEDVAHARSGYVDDPDALERAFLDELARDVMLFEGGAFQEFLALRGQLLPSDEASMAQEWLHIERSVHEVVSTQPGESITLRDVRTGDIHEVRTATIGTQVELGGLYCARVVPAGGTMQLFGGLERVSPEDRDDLIALLDDLPDPIPLVEFLSRHHPAGPSPDAEEALPTP